MKQIDINFISCSYPVGSDWNNINLIIETYFNAFNRLINEKFKSTTGVNLWCRGSSGAILAGLFASKISWLNPRICHSKKEGESSHQTTPYHFSDNENVINVVIDDFVSSGATIRAILSEMKSLYVTPDVLMVCSLGSKFADEFDYIITYD